jgi:integrase
MSSAPKGEHFGSAKESAKLVRAIANAVRRARLDYEGFRRVSVLVRKELGLRRPPRSRRLPRILPEASLKKFYEVIDQAGDLVHQIMLRLLFYTAVRVSELAAIKVEDVDLDGCKVFIELGKGKMDRYIPLPPLVQVDPEVALCRQSPEQLLVRVPAEDRLSGTSLLRGAGGEQTLIVSSAARSATEERGALRPNRFGAPFPPSRESSL